MSIALSIVEIAEKKARETQVSQFSAIDLEIGTLAGIEFDALDFVWEAAVHNSVLQNAVKRIHKIPAKACCEDCGEVYKFSFIYDYCPSCGSYHKRILQGKELRVKRLETF